MVGWRAISYIVYPFTPLHTPPHPSTTLHTSPPPTSPLPRLRQPKVDKAAKRRGLTDLLSALKSEGLQATDSAPPIAAMHPLAAVSVESPLAAATLALSINGSGLDTSEYEGGGGESEGAGAGEGGVVTSTSATTATTLALWRKADKYFYRTLCDSACLKVEANGRCSPDIGLRERRIVLRVSERCGW